MSSNKGKKQNTKKPIVKQNNKQKSQDQTEKDVEIEDTIEIPKGLNMEFYDYTSSSDSDRDEDDKDELEANEDIVNLDKKRKHGMMILTQIQNFSYFVFSS